MEIVPNIHMVDGSIGCNTYLIVGDGITLVDTGLRGNVPRIYGYLSRIGHGPGDIRRIVITHAHLDHINCLHQIRRETGATVIANARDADIIEGRQPLRVAKGLFGAMFRALQTYYKYTPVNVDVRLGDGDRIAGALDLKAVYLPGHSEGNMGIYSQDRSTFFSSDTIRVADGRLVRPSPRFTADMNEAVESIRRIGEFDFNVMLPGHGSPVTDKASTRVRELYHDIRQ